MTGQALPEDLIGSKMDRMLEVLSRRQRRLALLTLRGTDRCRQTDLLMRDSEGRDPEIELVHTHLPKLEAAGLIDWDRETGEVTRGPNYEEIEPLLELIEDHADELPPDWP